MFAQTDGDDRPKHPPIIKGAEVIWNPFEDIVPRTTPEEKLAAAAAQRSAALSGCPGSGTPHQLQCTRAEPIEARRP